MNGAGGDAEHQRRIGDSVGRTLEAAMDQWAIKQSRPGGVLARY